ncbi:MAG: biosynthetic-type acetolactate synthase large subunit [bacterium]
MKMTGAEILLKSLLEEKVSTVFGYPGGANMPLYDALFSYEKEIKHVLVRHEQGAAHAAEGYARITGRPGVCFSTSGPGATNLVTGIADAHMDSIPLVCITGQVAAHLIGTDAFQEIDIVGITKPITKWSIQVTKVEQIEDAIHTAFRHAASGRPGPVLIDIAKSAQLELGEFMGTTMNKKGANSAPHIDERVVVRAAQLLNTAKRPLIIVGHGVLISRAQKELLELVEKTGAPVAATLLGLSSLPCSHPQYVGMVGMHGNFAPNVLTNKADVILAIGMRFDDRVTSTLATYAPQARIIHVDIDPKEINKNIKVEVPLLSDAKIAIRALLPRLTCSHHEGWMSTFKSHEKKERDEVIHSQTHPTEGSILMAEVVNQLSQLTKGEAVIVADVGQNQMMAARYYQFEKFDRFYTSGGLGTMGFGLPAAIGAQFGSPSEQVIAIIGDGGFQMNIQELGTVAQEKIPIKMIVLNNGFLGMVRQWQQMFFNKRYSFTTMHSPDFVSVGKAYGIESKKVLERSHLKNTLQEMLDFKGPYLLEIDVEKEGNVFPMIAPGASVSDIRLS